MGLPISTLFIQASHILAVGTISYTPHPCPVPHSCDWTSLDCPARPHSPQGQYHSLQLTENPLDSSSTVTCSYLHHHWACI